MSIYNNIIDNLDNIKLPINQPLKTGKASGWGIFNYHWVQLPVNEENYNNNHVSAAIKWCHEYLGKSGTRWFEKKSKFYFKDEKDMTMFILQFGA